MGNSDDVVSLGLDVTSELNLFASYDYAKRGAGGAHVRQTPSIWKPRVQILDANEGTDELK